jgi:membrane protein DedA with SNARE-associated domain
MVEQILTFLQSVPAIYLLLIVFGLALVENLFPPSPSDIVILFAGTLIPISKVDFISLLIFSTLGSVVGFLIMFTIGQKFERSVVETGKLKYIPKDAIFKVESWFQKWGYWIIVVNRFLSGTRAVVSFFAGMSGLKVRKTTLLSGVSALLWNSILIFLGMEFSSNWKEIFAKVESYGNLLFITIGLIILLFVIRYFINKRKINKIK